MSEFRTLERQDVNENFALLIKALQGDVVIKLSQTTAAPTAAACAAAAQVYNIGIRLETAAGELQFPSLIGRSRATAAAAHGRREYTGFHPS